MAELDRLLGFMSSWDRQAALKTYQRMFAASADVEALMEELGSPTKLAVELASSYVPTLSPSALAEALTQCPVALEDLLRAPGVLVADLSLPEFPDEQEEETAEDTPAPETWLFDPEQEPAPEEVAEEPASRVRAGALIAYLIPAVVIGLPVAVLLVCLGLPFLGGGAALMFGAVYEAAQVIPQLSLLSDTLLTGGMALITCGLGLLLCWFGLWLSMELCWLWVGRAVIGLGKRLCVREEAA